MRGLLAPPQSQGAMAVSSGSQHSGAPRSASHYNYCRLSVNASAGGQRTPAVRAAATRRRQAVRTPPVPDENQALGLQQANNIVPTPISRLPGTDKAKLAHQRQQQECAAVAEAGAVVGAAGSSGSSSAAVAPGMSRPGSQLDGAHRPVGMVVGSAWLLSATVQLTGAAAAAPLWLPVLAGGLVGGLFLAAHEHGVRCLWRSPDTPLRVLITGGSSGVDKALAREFLKAGDTVLITSRSAGGVQQAVEQLREESGAGVHVMGMECNVSSPASVDCLMDAVARLLGGPVDVVINNAGYSGSFQGLMGQTAEQVRQVVETNLLGSLLVTRAAMNQMAQQPGGGHIFNTEGAGSDGSATPQYAAYGATKCALAQLLKSLQHEAAGLPNPVRVHNLSPGMVLTPLLLDGATPKSKQVFNILCEHPEIVAAFLVPRVRSVVALGEAGRSIRFLTPARALAKFLTAPLHAGKYFDKHGRAVYAPERERLLSAAQAKKTQRRQQLAARRNVPLQLAYSLGMAVSFLLIVSDALAKAPGTGTGL